jgi:hypothetical protein
MGGLRPLKKECTHMTNANVPFEFYAHLSSYKNDGMVLQFHAWFAGVKGPFTAPGFVGVK